MQTDPQLVPELGAASDSQPPRARPRVVAAVAASVAAVALVAAGILVLSRSHHDRAPIASPSSGHETASGVHVPWNAATLRSDTAAVPAAAKVAAPPGLRQCANTDLQLESGRTTVAADGDGWLKTDFVLRSIAATPCSVRTSFIDVQLVSANGTALPTDAIPHGGVVFPQALLLRPDQLISGAALWAVYEGRAPHPTRLVINPDGRAGGASEALSVSLAGVAIPPHPRNPSNRGPWRATSYGFIDKVTDPGTLASLTASVAAPATIVIGEILRYSVTLTNPTTTEVPLSPCPDFAQRLDVVPAKYATTVGFRGTLNCAQAPKSIAPRDSVTFDYQLDTTGQIPGPGSLTWQLLQRSTAAVAAQTRLTVTH
jgi:hypothetical protein